MLSLLGLFFFFFFSCVTKFLIACKVQNEDSIFDRRVSGVVPWFATYNY